MRQRLFDDDERLDDERLLEPRLALARPPRLDDELLRLLPRLLEALLRSVKRPWLSRAWPRLEDDFEDDERDELLRDAMVLLLGWLDFRGTFAGADATGSNLGAPRVRTVGHGIASM